MKLRCNVIKVISWILQKTNKKFVFIMKVPEQWNEKPLLLSENDKCPKVCQEISNLL